MIKEAKNEKLVFTYQCTPNVSRKAASIVIDLIVASSRSQGPQNVAEGIHWKVRWGYALEITVCKLKE